MARISVYRNRPFLTLFSWLGGGCIFSGLASLFSGAFLTAYITVLMGAAIVYFCNCKSAGQKVRYNARFIGVLILVFQAVYALQLVVDGSFSQDFSLLWLIVSLLVAAALFIPRLNKPLFLALVCFVLQAVLMVVEIAILMAFFKDPSAGAFFLVALPMLFPGVMGLILIFRCRAMRPFERQLYAF